MVLFTTTTTVDRLTPREALGFGPGRLLATLLCLLPLSLHPVMFYVSLLVVSLSLVSMWFLAFLVFFLMVLVLRVVQFLLVLFQVGDIHDRREFPIVALQNNNSSASVHGGGALRHLELAPSIYSKCLS